MTIRIRRVLGVAVVLSAGVGGRYARRPSQAENSSIQCAEGVPG